ncbi:MAG: acetyl-CoA carboxylase biotin carboxyl carrier protein subunit [Saprospiraceae bacterium]
MYKVIIDNEEIEITAADINAVDMVKTKNGGYHLLKNNIAYNIEYLEEDDLHKNLKLLINGTTYNLTIKDEFDQIVDTMGFSSSEDELISDIIAPMPGLILDIMVSVGDVVEEGKSLLILEAMKMENVIKASGVGTIKSINNKKGDAVNKGAIIIEME